MKLLRPACKNPMDRALLEAEAAAERGEVPVGAVIIDSDGLDHRLRRQSDARTSATRQPMPK